MLSVSKVFMILILPLIDLLHPYTPPLQCFLDDPEFSELDLTGMKSDDDSDDDYSVIEIASDSKKENHRKGKKGLLVKAYHVKRPLADK